MRILFVTEQFPYPLHDGGNLRSYHLLRGLSEEHEVRLLSHAPADMTSIAQLQSVCQVEVLPPVAKMRRLARNLLRPGAWRQPTFLWKGRSQPLLERLIARLQGESFDAIHFNHLDTACFAAEFRWPQLQVFDSHNCLSLMEARRRAKRSEVPWASWHDREIAALRRWEAAVCRRTTLTLACSHLDAEAFRNLYPDAQVEVVSNGVDAEYFRPGSPISEEPGALVFTGTMSYGPNEEAAHFFCKEILPILRQRNTSVRAYFVGRNPSSRVRALHDGNAVHVTGAVDDVRPYLHRAQAVIVPLRHGGGTRLKILEAFAMGKSVVSTSVGAEGIPVVDGENILLADTPIAFAEAIERLLRDADYRRQLADEARRFAQSQFDWRLVRRRLLSIYADLSQRHVIPLIA